MNTFKEINIYNDNIEPEALNQFYEVMKQPWVLKGALMPDAHAGYVLPIGGVVLTQNQIVPSFIGYDIGCGVCAVALNIPGIPNGNPLDLMRLRDDIIESIPLGMQRFTKKQKIIQRTMATKDTQEIFNKTAPLQIGTLGGGNHFIELGYDNSERLNIIIHSGSRGVGYKIAEHYMKISAISNVDEKRYQDEFDVNNKDWYNKAHKTNDDNLMEKYNKAKQEFVYRRTRARLNTKIEGIFPLQLGSEEGDNYLHDMNQMLEFALENRKTMIDKIITLIEKQVGKVIQERFINRNHNHAEVTSEGIIHRKGATHADKGMLGVIPGNMKDGCFIVEGKGNPNSLCSSSHGAGRVLSRMQAKKQLSVDTFHSMMQGIITNHSDDTLDESPEAYKDIFEVMELQKDLVEVIDYVKPILNIKG